MDPIHFTASMNKPGEGGYSACTPMPANACNEQRAIEKQKTLVQKNRNPSSFIGTNKEDGDSGTCTPTPLDASNQERAIEKEKTPMQKKILHGQLSRAQIELLVDRVLKLYPQEVQMYRSFAKRELSIAYLEGVV